MLTPAFEIQQDDVFITIIIKTPYARITDTEIFIEENEFRFHSKPYFLRLLLPGSIIEDGREEAKYDTDKGSYTIKVPKETKGQQFEGLDMITKLLTPKGQTTAQSPMIEVLSESNNTGVDKESEEEVEDVDEEEDIDWHIEQIPYTEPELSLDCPKYGFANQKSGIFSRLQDEVVGVVDLINPDQCTMSERREKRQAAEQEKFDEDHYLADLYDDDAIQELLRYNPHTGYDSSEGFTDEDKEIMRNLPKKEYLIDNRLSVYLGLVDIIFAYCYDIRSTEGEHNVESTWTISKLSSTLSWMDSFTSIEDTVTASYRRCLCYPLYRNWQFTVQVHRDTAHIFNCGKERILKFLLDIHKCFSKSYPCYLLNDLYITDYCVWIQSADSKQLQSLTEAIQKCHIKKIDLGLDLPSIESQTAAAFSDNDVDDVIKAVSKVNLSQHDSDDEDTDSDCSGSDEYTECSGSDDSAECSGSDENTEGSGIDGNTKCSGIDGNTHCSGIDKNTHSLGIDENTHCSGIDENTDCSGSVTCTETCDESTHSLTSTTESNDEIPHNDTNTVSKLND